MARRHHYRRRTKGPAHEIDVTTFLNLMVVLVPFLDRGVVRRGRSPMFTALGWAGLAYIVGMTAWGYHSWVPVYVILATVVLVFVLGLGTRTRS